MITKPSDFGGLCFSRVVVVGANGAGKTLTATQIATAYDLPLIHNDALALTRNWKYRSRSETARMRASAVTGPAWVLEGGPSVLTANVLARASLVIWLDPPAPVRIWRIFWRSLRYMGRTRPEHPGGNREWPGLRQTRFLIRAANRQSVFARAIDMSLQGCPCRVLRLRRRSQVAALLAHDSPMS